LDEFEKAKFQVLIDALQSFIDEGNDHPTQIMIGKRVGRGMGSHPTVSKWLWRAEAYGLVEMEPIPGGRGRLAGYRYRIATKRLKVVEDSSSSYLESSYSDTTTRLTTKSRLVVSRKARSLLGDLRVEILRDNGVWEESIPECLATGCNEEYLEALERMVKEKPRITDPAAFYWSCVKKKSAVPERFWKTSTCWRCFKPVGRYDEVCPNCGEVARR